MLSHVKPTIKVWESSKEVATSNVQNSNTSTYDHIRNCLGFVHLTSQLALNFFKFLSYVPHVITWHLNKFRNFLILFEFYIIKNHFYHTWMIMFCGQGLQNFGSVFRYGLKIYYSTRISFFECLAFIISCTYSSK